MKFSTSFVFCFFFFPCILFGTQLYAGVEPDVFTAKPNILLIVADDMGVNDSAIYNPHPVISLPAIEALANESTVYTRFFTESTCSSSRAALLTGQYAARNGFVPVARGISNDIETLPKLLSKAGYSSHHVGKWHIGEINPYATPAAQGFDSSFGFLGQWFLKGPDKYGNKVLRSPGYYNPWLEDEKGTWKQYQGHLTEILAQHTTSLIRKGAQQGAPWFIYHAFFAPHTPLQPSPKYLEAFGGAPEQKYRALLKQMDDSVALMVSALKETHQYENTVIIFLSDNGAKIKHVPSNLPFDGAKGEYEEGGIHTPMFVRWVSELGIPVGRNNVPVAIMDILPTLADLAGLAVSHSDGTSLLSIAQDKGPLQKRAPFGMTNDQLSIVSEDGKYHYFRRWFFNDLLLSKLVKYTAPDGFKYAASQDKQKKSFYFNRFIQWQHQVRDVSLQFRATDSGGGHGVVTGKDFLRSPINPVFTMGIGLYGIETEAFLKKSGRQSLIFQKGLLDVWLESGNLKVTLFNKMHTEVPLAALKQSAECIPLILTGSFADKFSSLGKKIRPSELAVILGDQISETSKRIPLLPDEMIVNPTYIGFHPEIDAQQFKGSLGRVHLLADRIYPDFKTRPTGLDEFKKRLCQNTD